jgi:hypothetical protein
MVISTDANLELAKMVDEQLPSQIFEFKMVAPNSSCVFLLP